MTFRSKYSKKYFLILNDSKWVPKTNYSLTKDFGAPSTLILRVDDWAVPTKEGCVIFDKSSENFAFKNKNRILISKSQNFTLEF